MQHLPVMTVVIPTFRRRDSVARALYALAGQTLTPSFFEVIVVIDGSKDGTREVVASYEAPYSLRYIWQANQGRAVACNVGIRAALGQFVVLLDDDMEPAPGFLEGHLQEHARYDRMGVLGSVPVIDRDRSKPVVGFIASKFRQHMEKLAQPGYQVQIRDFYSGNFSIKKEILFEVGLFDEIFRIYGNEDLDLFSRLAQAGVRFLFSPKALAYQHYEKSFDEFAWDQFNHGQTSVLLAKKHPEAFLGMRLSTYAEGSRQWRWLRSLLLKLSLSGGQTSKAVLHLIHWLEHWQPARLHLYYSRAADYFYWWGVKQVTQEAQAEKHEHLAFPHPGFISRSHHE